jgi:predicted ferric reductase
MNANKPAPIDQPPTHALHTVLPLLLAVILGTGLAIAVLPAWVPALSTSIVSPEPKAFWYLSRSSAFVAYGLLWASMMLGLLMTSKLAPIWPGGPTTYEMHQHSGLLGLGFGLFHGLILLGDHYTGFSIVQVLLPFATTSYRPLWVGLGQMGLYLAILVGLSVYVRPQIGKKLWRAIHFLSFLAFGMAFVHGLGSGTDTSTIWAQGLYFTTGLSILFLLVYRIYTSARRHSANTLGKASGTFQ